MTFLFFLLRFNHCLCDPPTPLTLEPLCTCLANAILLGPRVAFLVPSTTFACVCALSTSAPHLLPLSPAPRSAPPSPAIEHGLDSSYVGGLQSPVEPDYSKSSSSSLFLSAVAFPPSRCLGHSHLLHSVRSSRFQNNFPRRPISGTQRCSPAPPVFPSVLWASPRVCDAGGK